MTTDKKIIRLYKETYQNESLKGITLKEMEESLIAFYQAVGFNVNTVDDILAYKDLEGEFVKQMEKIMHGNLASVNK